MDYPWIDEGETLSLKDQWNKFYQRKIKENYIPAWVYGG